MRAKLKSLSSTDILAPLENWQPSDKFDFGILVDAEIGTEGEVGQDRFNFTVCSPKWLGAELDRQLELEFSRTWGSPYQLVKDYIVLREWNYEKVREILLDLCRRSEGVDWSAITRRLSRYGHWEFEGMEDDK